MSTTWEFVKRHKGKIITGGLLISGVAAYVIHAKEHSYRAMLPEISEGDRMRNQARRHYVFDTNHRACDQSIVDIVPNVQTLIQGRFDIEALIHKLKVSNDLTVDEKVEIWNKVKVYSIARIIGIAYSYSLLTLALKTQISILAADICSQFDHAPSWIELCKSQLQSYLGFDAVPSLGAPANEGNVATSRKIFIQCIQYLTNTGVSKLLDVVENICSDVCSNISLTDDVDQDSLRETLDSIDSRLSMLEPKFFSSLVAPLSVEERSSSDSIMKLVLRLIKSLESTMGKETLSSLVDFYLTAAVHKTPKEPVVLAKLLPSMPDVFNFISSDEYDSPLKTSLCSSDVYTYAKFVFRTH